MPPIRVRSIRETVTVSGGTSIVGTASFTGNTSVINTVTVTGNTSVINTITITGNTTLLNGNNVVGQVKLTDGTDIADVLDLTNSNPLTVAIVDGTGSQITSFGGGTQYTEDDASASNPVGTVPILVRKDTPSTEVSTDGDNVAQRGTNYGAAYVTLLDTSGSPVSVGGGTQYTEDVAAVADPIGTMNILVRADSLSAVTNTDGDNIAARATNKGEQYVKHVDTVTITGSTAIVGSVTITGSTSVVNTVTITGSTTLVGTSTITGSTSVVNTVTITGSTGIVSAPTLTKGTQGSTGFSVQRLQDAGRTHVRYFATAGAVPATGVEGLVTLTKSSQDSATSTGTSHTITSGKTYRITAITYATRGHNTATAQVTTFNLRLNTGGAVTTASTPVLMAVRSATPATANSWDRVFIQIPDGMEIVGDGTKQFGVSTNSTYVTNAPTVDVTIIGFEY